MQQWPHKYGQIKNKNQERKIRINYNMDFSRVKMMMIRRGKDNP